MNKELQALSETIKTKSSELFKKLASDLEENEKVSELAENIFNLTPEEVSAKVSEILAPAIEAYDKINYDQIQDIAKLAFKEYLLYRSLDSKVKETILVSAGIMIKAKLDQAVKDRQPEQEEVSDEVQP